LKSEGKINGLGSSSRDISSRMAGFYGNGMKAASRQSRSRLGYPSKRYGKALAVIFLVATSAVVVSALAMNPGRQVPAGISDIPAPPNLIIGGFTFDEFSAKLGDCAVTITHVKTGNFTVLYSGASGPTLGFYSYKPSWEDISQGDDIKVTAVKGVMTGESVGYVSSSPNLQIDVTLNVLIPEFPMVIVPVVGMMALIAVVSLRRRGGEQ